MSSPSTKKNQTGEELRRAAEAEQRKVSSGAGPDCGDLERLVHELQVHQIELEAQNRELQETRKELQQARDRYADLYDFAPLSYLSVDRGNRIREANLTACQMLEAERNKLIGKSFSSFIAPEHRGAFYQQREKVLAGARERGWEAKMHKTGGKHFYVRLDMKYYAGDFRITFVDITEDKLMEEALQEGTQRLAEANKELEAFAYSISHDLRSPLRAIEGFARMLLKTLAARLDEEEMRKFAVIRENARRMNELIGHLLDFSRLGRQALSFSLVDMDYLVRKVWENLVGENPKRHLELRLGELPPAWGDEALLTQVVQNLLSNAVKFTQTREAAVIEVEGGRQGMECAYSVKDNGVGFNVTYKSKLFKVFQRLHGGEEFEGTGVGLAIVKRIVQRHGGRIWAEGAVNEGATFTFTLPLPEPMQ